MFFVLEKNAPVSERTRFQGRTNVNCFCKNDKLIQADEWFNENHDTKVTVSAVSNQTGVTFSGLPRLQTQRSSAARVSRETYAESYLSTFDNFHGVENARQLVSDILPIARGRYK